MAKSRTLLEDVIASAKACHFGPTPWIQKLPADLQEELQQVKTAFKDKSIDIRKNALAKSIKDAVEARGFQCVNQAGVVRWLDQG